MDAVVVAVSVDVALEPGVRLTLVGLTATVRPVAVGDTDADSDTLPVNPRLAAVIVEVAEPPGVVLILVGLALRVKSLVTVRVTVALWVVVPLVPVTVIV